MFNIKNKLVVLTIALIPAFSLSMELPGGGRARSHVAHLEYIPTQSLYNEYNGDLEFPNETPEVPYYQRMYAISHLFGAALEGNIEKVRKALANGDNPNITNEDGETILFYIANDPVAIGETQYEIAKLLLEHGANPKIQTTGRIHKNQNALYAAKRWNHQELLKLFKQWAEKEYLTVQQEIESLAAQQKTLMAPQGTYLELLPSDLRTLQLKSIAAQIEELEKKKQELEEDFKDEFKGALHDL